MHYHIISNIDICSDDSEVIRNSETSEVYLIGAEIAETSVISVEPAPLVILDADDLYLNLLETSDYIEEMNENLADTPSNERIEHTSMFNVLRKAKYLTF